ncbi:hypothetical protein ACX8XN_14755 [Calditrichota bacterium GD2]
MLEFTGSVKNNLLHGAEQKNKGLLSKGEHGVALKEQNGLFYNLWAAQSQTPDKQVKASNEPIVIPVQTAAARVSKNPQQKIAADTKQGRIPTALDHPEGQDTGPAAENSLQAFVLSVPMAAAQKTSGAPSAIPAGQTALETLTARILQATLNSRALAGLSSKIVKVDYQIEPGSLATIQQKLGLNTAKGVAGLSGAAQSEKGSVFFKNLNGQMWEAVENPAEMQRLVKQLNLKTTPGMEATINAQKGQGEAPLALEVKINAKGLSALQNPDAAGLQQGSMSRLEGKKGGAKNPTAPQTSVNNEPFPSATAQKDADLNVSLRLKVEPVQKTMGSSVLEGGLAETLKQSQTQTTDELFKQLKIEIQQLPTPVFNRGASMVGPNVAAASHFSNLENVVAKIQELLDQARAMHLQNRNIQMSLEETPMGKMDIQYRSNEHQLTIVVENEQIKNELLKFTPVIQQNLAEKGIALNGFQVNVGQFGQSEGGKHASGKNNHKTTNAAKEGKEVTAHESQPTALNRKFGYNTMEITI